MSLKLLYPAIETASHAMTAVYDPVFERYCQKFGISSQSLYLLLAIPTFEPKPVSVENLNIRSPYTAAEHYHALLQELTHANMVALETEGQYRITQHGLEVLKETLTAVYNELGEIKSLPLIDQMDLASRLKILTDACLTAPDPPGTWCIRHARRLDPGSRVPMMVRIDQFLSELQAFRDDAHLAAWQGIESNGHAWDILTHLWSKKEAEPDRIFQDLVKRGNTREQTQHAVELLIRRGWITRDNRTLRITPFGTEIRQTAETTTDQYFLAPFRTISAVEMAQTITLIEELHRGISTYNAGV